MLKGKLKKEFEEWLITKLDEENNWGYHFCVSSFKNLPFELQKGVYEVFFIVKFNVFARLGQDDDSKKYYYKTRTEDLLLLTSAHKTIENAYKEWLKDMNVLHQEGVLK